MDLYRVVTATGDITKPTASESAKEFLDHALRDFDKFVFIKLKASRVTTLIS